MNRESSRPRKQPSKLKLLSSRVLSSVVIACCLALLFSTVSQSYDLANRVRQAESNMKQQQQVDVSAEREYNKEVSRWPIQYRDSWSVDRDVNSEGYGEYLSLLGDSQVGVLSFLGRKVPVYHGTSDDSLDHGAGHMWGTSIPLGEPGELAGFAAHSGTGDLRFDGIDKMQPGELFTLSTSVGDVTYRVDSFHVVSPEDVDVLERLRPAPGEPGRAVLITCGPSPTFEKRYVILAHVTSTSSGLEDTPSRSHNIWWDVLQSSMTFVNMLLGLVLVLAMYSLVSSFRRNVNKPRV